MPIQMAPSFGTVSIPRHIGTKLLPHKPCPIWRLFQNPEPCCSWPPVSSGWPGGDDGNVKPGFQKSTAEARNPMLQEALPRPSLTSETHLIFSPSQRQEGIMRTPKFWLSLTGVAVGLVATLAILTLPGCQQYLPW